MKLVLYTSVFLLFSYFVNAQVGIGTTAPVGTLDVSALNPTGATTNVDGILIPRVTRQRAQSMVSTPTSTLIYINEVVTGTATGLTVNVTSVGFYFFDGAAWVKLITGNPGWLTTGNSGLSGTANFLGTTDAVDVAFRRSNATAGKIGATSTSFGVGALNSGASSNSTAFGNNALSVSTGSNNVAFGQNALQNCNTTAQWNTAVGTDALKGINSNAAQYNVAVGFGAMSLGTGAISQCTAVGSNALQNSTGANSTAVGFYALGGAAGTTTGADNTAIGISSLRQNTSGTSNTGVGANSLQFNGTSSNNVGIGHSALRSGGGNSVAVGANALINNTATGSTAVGYNALAANIASTGNTGIGFSTLGNTTGANNTALGYQAGNAVGAGTNNVLIGYQAGFSNTTSGNVNIGYQAGSAESTGNKLYISNSNANASNALIYGDFSGTKILRTNSTFQIGDPAGTGYVFPIARGTINQVLQTNGSGVMSWVSPSSLSITETDPQVASASISAVPRWDGTSLVDGIVADDGANVGIGVAPTVGNKLAVAGNTKTTNFQMTTGATANYILQSDAGGNATWVQNPLYALSLVRVNLGATNQMLTAPSPAGTWEKINFAAGVFDTNSEFSSGTFTAVQDGYFRVNAGFHTNDQSNTQQFSIGVFVNGILYQETSSNHSGTGEVSRNVNCIVNLAIGDNVEIFVKNFIVGVEINNFTEKTFFEVQQIK